MRRFTPLFIAFLLLAPTRTPLWSADPPPSPAAPVPDVDLELLPAPLYRSMLERDVLETRSRFAENDGRHEDAYGLQLRVVELDQQLHGAADARALQSLMRLVTINSNLKSSIPEEYTQRTLSVLEALLDTSGTLVDQLPNIAATRAALRRVKADFIARAAWSDAQQRAIAEATALAAQAKDALAAPQPGDAARLFREALARIEQDFDAQSSAWAESAFVVADGLWSAGELDEAVTLFSKALPIFRSAFGESAAFLVSTEWSGRLVERAHAHMPQRQWASARELLDNARLLQAERFGDPAWQVRDVDNSLAHLERRRNLGEEQLIAIETAEQQLDQGQSALQTTGLFQAAAIDLAGQNARQSAEALRTTLGAEDPLTIRALVLQAAVAGAQNDAGQQLKLVRELATAVETARGTDHPETQSTLDQLTGLLLTAGFEAMKAGEFDQARALISERHALNIRRYTESGWQPRSSAADLQTVELLAAAGAEQHAKWVRARSLQDEVVASFRMAKFRENIDRAAEVVALDREVLGGSHLTTALSIANLAAQHRELGERDRAVELYAEVRRIRAEVVGQQHPDYIEVLTNIGYAHNMVGDSNSALPVLQEAVDIARNVSPYSYGDALRTLAYSYRNMGLSVQAEAMFREAATVLATAGGPQDFVTLMASDGWGIELRKMGRYQEAIAQLASVAENWRSIQGEASFWFGDSMNSLGVAMYFGGRYEEAIPVFEQALKALEQSAGPRSPNYANVLANLAMASHRAGHDQQSADFVERYLANRRQEFGEQSPAYVNALLYIGSSQLLNIGATRSLNAAEAEFAQRHLGEAARLAIAVAGEDSPLHADILKTRGIVHRVRNEFQEAIALLERAAEIHDRQSGPEHRSTIETRNSLAAAYSWSGDTARALMISRDSLERALRAQHSLPGDTIAIIRRELGALLIGINDLDGAEALLRESLRHYRQTVGDHHPNYAVALAYLGQIYLKRHDLEFAERVFQECLAIQKNTFGADTPDYAARLLDVATVERKLGRLPDAEEHARHAASLLERLGDSLVPHINARLLLVDILLDAGQLDEAASLLASVRTQVENTLGPLHVTSVGTTRREGLLALRRSDRAAAADRFDRAVVASGRTADVAMAAQSERQRLAARQTLEEDLSLYLSATDDSPDAARSAYRFVMSFKGAVFASQAHQRLVRSKPELAAEFEQLAATSRRIATLTFAKSTADDRAASATELRDLTRERERLEISLAARSGLSELSHAFDTDDVDALLDKLPPDVVVVDFLEYTHSRPPESAPGPLTTERRIAAFVLSQAGGVARVELGQRDDIAAAVEAFRQSVLEQATQDGAAAPGLQLRALAWAPLEPLLRDAQHVLISPDGVIARIPFAGLPGADPEKFLVEERGVAVVPFPRLLLDASPAPDAETANESTESLLLVGDVDFRGNAGKTNTAVATRSAMVRGSRRNWDPLPATRTEALAVRDSFELKYADGAAEFLRGARATEAAFCENAGEHRWIHVATHGFFATPGQSSASPAEPGAPQSRVQFDVEGFHPGLLSGLVFAGANSESDAGSDDGILTALEIAQLDLARTEMVVLSACETGLGAAAGGEGLLGLQRAFQVAGARATVASLWIVNDLATRRLMERFYANLWDPDKRLSKLEALREAQLWMLNDPDQARGATPDEDPSTTRTPPFFWAAFQLSGDWR